MNPSQLTASYVRMDVPAPDSCLVCQHSKPERRRRGLRALIRR